MVNIAYIFQPHFNTSMFRVAVRDQQSEDTNFIVVTCSPQYNGVWKYDGELHKNCGRWINKKTTCYEIPISSCTFVKSLDEVSNKSVIRRVVEQQRKWLENLVTNRDYIYESTPSWILRETRDELGIK